MEERVTLKSPVRRPADHRGCAGGVARGRLTAGRATQRDAGGHCGLSESLSGARPWHRGVGFPRLCARPFRRSGQLRTRVERHTENRCTPARRPALRQCRKCACSGFADGPRRSLERPTSGRRDEPKDHPDEPRPGVCRQSCHQCDRHWSQPLRNAGLHDPCLLWCPLRDRHGHAPGSPANDCRDLVRLGHDASCSRTSRCDSFPCARFHVRLPSNALSDRCMMRQRPSFSDERIPCGESADALALGVLKNRPVARHFLMVGTSVAR